jgi:hypothetical protein
MIIHFKIKVLKVGNQLITEEWDKKEEYKKAVLKLSDTLKDSIIKYFKKQKVSIALVSDVENG